MTSNKDLFYIGIVGQIASGKGILVDYLVKKYGFIPFSLSTIVHEEVKKRKITNFNRQTLQDIGDDLREKYGRDILARRAVEKLQSSYKSKKFFVIEGIRNQKEVAYLKSLPNSVIIGVKAKREERFRRLLTRQKPWDPKTWEEFLVIDRRDLGIGQKQSGQQVGKCLVYCDYVLLNNKDLEDFQRKADKLIQRILKLNNLA